MNIYYHMNNALNFREKSIFESRFVRGLSYFAIIHNRPLELGYDPTVEELEKLEKKAIATFADYIKMYINQNFVMPDIPELVAGEEILESAIYSNLLVPTKSKNKIDALDDDKFHSLKIESLFLDTAIENILLNANVNTVKNLFSLGEGKLLKIKFLGLKRLLDIKQALGQRGQNLPN